jgi:hypothetical protein
MTKVVKLGSFLENWRASETRFSAIERRIAKIVGRQDTHPAEPSSLVKLFRARENARQSADKWWALLVQDVNRDQQVETGAERGALRDAEAAVFDNRVAEEMPPTKRPKHGA